MGLDRLPTAPPNAPTHPKRTPLPTRVLVIAHVFYPEIWPELEQRIRNVPVPVTLAVTLVEGRSDHLTVPVRREFPAALVDVVPNRGRDAWPFVRLLQEGILTDDTGAVLKLHTKDSVHRLDGRRWRRRMLDSLCGSSASITQILELLGEDPHIGVVAPRGGVLGREFWGSNGPTVDALADRLGVAVDLERTFFPAGSMFWARPEAVRRFGDLALDSSDFPEEPLPIDGTLAHAIERFVGVLATAEGLEVISADEVSDRLARIRSARPREDSDAG
jgi:lipopolysaccharide biosynthesis protein